MNTQARIDHSRRCEAEEMEATELATDPMVRDDHLQMAGRYAELMRSLKRRQALAA